MPLALFLSLPLLRRCDNAVVFVEGGVPLFHERRLSHRADLALLKKSLRSAFCCGRRRRSCYADLRRSAACINVADARIFKGRENNARRRRYRLGRERHSSAKRCWHTREPLSTFLQAFHDAFFNGDCDTWSCERRCKLTWMCWLSSP